MLLLVLQTPLHAQNYLKLPPTGAHWKLEEGYQDIFSIESYAYFLETTGDTVYFGYPTTKVQMAGFFRCQGLSGPGQSIQYIYQDSLGRAYTVDNQGALERLYDLSLQVGDTMMTTGGNGGPLEYLVDSIDTVTYADNIPRKRLYLTCYGFINSGNQAIWVEGIGDILHGPFPAFEFENWRRNLCYGEGGQFLTLGTTAYACGALSSDCYLLVGLETAAPAFTLAPNPTHDRIRITQAEAQALHVRLLALDGRVLGAWELAGAREMEIGLPEVAAGMYLLHIQDGRGCSSSHRLRID